ncbi:MAG TPA: molybdate ABC transporter substrate-binding protein [Methylomirabilota bacterium]|nr:molybdate ABC transporter substrate-binding protein [Methylomirabilota bacterium]
MKLVPFASSCLPFFLCAAALTPRGPALSPQSREIRVAAAADLQFAMKDLAAEYEKGAGNKVIPTFGSSGNFFSQIQNGAPFDAFFSADVEYARKLEASGHAEPGTLFMYAIGRIVIWVPAGVRVDVARNHWDVLLDPEVQRVAVANPQHAPYGRAAVDALKGAGLFEKLEAKIVYGENISQTAQFVESGNAQAGILSYSHALSAPMKDKGAFWMIPQDLYPPIEQAAVVLKSSAQKDAARAFLAFVKGPAARAILERYGFTVPAVSAPPKGL